jgi:hypothetical protein
MAGGDITNREDVKTIGPGARLNKKLVTADVEFGNGAAGITTVTAAEIGLTKIEGFAAAVFGGTTNKTNTVSSTTAYASGGVTSIILECSIVDEVDNDLTDLTVSILFWGN